MTSYDERIDLALISIEDYRLNRLAVYIDEDNYNILVNSADYETYVTTCEENGIIATTKKEYNKIKDNDYSDYEDYVSDSLSTLETTLEGYMIRGLPNFNNCKNDLSLRDDDNKTFKVNLTDLEKSIIADYTVLMWLDKNINDTRQITGMLQNKNEARRYSEANLLKEKMNTRIEMRENINKKQLDYSFKNLDCKKWLDGEF